MKDYNDMDKACIDLVNTFINEPDLAYDFISTNYGHFSKSDLVDVIRELLYALRNDEEYIVSAGEELKENCWYYYFEEGETE